jgi:GTP-binding protein
VNTNNFYHTAKFLISATNLHQAPVDHGYEVAFVGRSNSGKSSAINALCNQKKLCRTSKTPGRTQLINFFQLDEERRLVDLPGYGYAQAPYQKQIQWQEYITDYLTYRVCLRGLILLMDIRHHSTEYDINLIQWSLNKNISIHVLLTKADKLNRGPALAQLRAVQQKLNEYPNIVGTQIFSAVTRHGLEQTYTILDKWLQRQPNTTTDR